jgi:hypothetical protein
MGTKKEETINHVYIRTPDYKYSEVECMPLSDLHWGCDYTKADVKELLFKACGITKDLLKENKKEEKENKGMEILDLYKERELEKVENLEKAEIEALKEEDPYQKIVKEANEKIFKIAKIEKREIYGVGYSVITRETEEKQEKIYQDYDKQEKEVIKLVSEIEALLKDTECYIQKVEILKAYGILDKSGKLAK